MIKRSKQSMTKPAANLTATRGLSAGKKVRQGAPHPDRIHGRKSTAKEFRGAGPINPAAADRVTPKQACRIKSPDLCQIQIWHIDRFVFYARNPRLNDAAVDRMCASIREFGFKIPVLARSDGDATDPQRWGGHPSPARSKHEAPCHHSGLQPA